MTNTPQNPLQYKDALTHLEERLNQIKKLPRTESGCKFLLLSLLYETQDVQRMFEQVVTELENTTQPPYIPLYDRYVDYWEWSSESHFQIASWQMGWPEKESNLNISNGLKRLLNVFALANQEKSLELTPYVQKLNEALWNMVDVNLMWSALMVMLKQLQKTLKEIGHLLKNRKINDQDAEKLFEGKLMDYNLSSEAKTVREMFENWKQEWNDEQTLRMHLKGKYLDELERLFQSGLLTPRIEHQKDIDPDVYEEEVLLQLLKRRNNNYSQETFFLYTAMRELFTYQNGWLIPSPKAIGRYFYKERKHIGEEHYKACFSFIQMTHLLSGEKSRSSAPSAVVKTDKRKETPPKASAEKGRKRTVIFLEEETRTALKQAVCNILSQYWNKNVRKVQVGNKSFCPTQFLLSIYFVCVEKGLTVSVQNQINSEYYRFLTSDCCITDIPSDKSFRTHLKRVADTGMDFHELTEESLNACKAPGKLTPKQWKEWKPMVDAARELLVKEGLIAESQPL